MEAFLSHNSQDKEVARQLGAHLKLVGADIWFDEWEIRAGESIPGKVDEALGLIDTLILLWSASAESSRWVRTELEAGIQRRIEDDSLRVVPVILDDTELPTLLRHIRWVDLRGGDVVAAVMEIMGYASDQSRIKAIQQTLDEAQVEVGYFPGFGAAVGCASCGAGLDKLKGWHSFDDSRDDEYAGVECVECGWNDGGEI